MNTYHEFSKIKDAFSKVREDMSFLVTKVSENYDEFMKNHQKLSNEVSLLSKQLHENLDKLRQDDSLHLKNASSSEIEFLKREIKDLKEEVKNSHKVHFDMTSTIDNVKKNSEDIKDLKDKLRNGELEIYLLKERLLEKDIELKQIKDVNKHMFNLIDELSNIELELINNSK